MKRKTVLTINFIAIVALLFLFAFNTANAQIDRIQTSAKSNKVFAVVNPGEGEYYIKVASTGKYCAVEGVSNNNGARLVQWDFAKNKNHQFIIKPSTVNGFYTIMALHSNKFLNVAGQSLASNAAIIQWDYVAQDNLLFSFEKAGDGQLLVRCKQSGLYIQLASGNNSNGIQLIQGADKQAFVLERVNGNSLKKSMDATQVGTLSAFKPIQLKLPQPGSNVPVIRSIKNTNLKLNAVYANGTGRVKDETRVIKENDNGTVKHKTVRLAGAERADMTVITNSDQIFNYTPGLIYDVRDLYSGNVMQKTKYINGEGRNPVTVVTSVANFKASDNKIDETVTVPSSTNLRQAIVKLNSRYTTAEDLTSIQNFRYSSAEVHNKTEFGFKLGAQAHYAMVSAGVDFEINNNRERKSIYIEGVKELYTLKVDPPQNGFFQQPPVEDPGNLAYISNVVYGVKIIGIVEIDNNEDAIRFAANAGVNFGIASAHVNVSNWSSQKNKNTKVKLYVIGGRSVDVGACTLDNFNATVDNLLRNVNYRVAQPIRIAASTLDGKLINFTDATDNFTYDEYTPAAVAKAPTTIIVDGANLKAKLSGPGTEDYDMYGKMWVMAYDKNNRNIPATNGDNHLFNFENEIDMSDEASIVKHFNKSVTIPIAADRVEDAYIDVCFAIVDKDAGGDWGRDDDDVFVFRDRAGVNKFFHYFPKHPISGAQRPMFCRKRFYIKDLDAANNSTDDLTTDGDEIALSFTIRKITQPD